jgi:hypothetical protein
MVKQSETPKLTIELVPSTAWGDNLRSALTKAEWDVLRKQAYQKAGYCCEVCGGKGHKWPVEAHEIWEFDDNTRIQTLKGLMALCPACHAVKHMGRSLAVGKGNQTGTHLARVNGWAMADVWSYYDRQMEIWEERSKHSWSLDISWAIEKLDEMSFIESSTGYFELGF